MDAQKNITKSANLVCYCFMLYKEKMLTDKGAQLIIEMETSFKNVQRVFLEILEIQGVSRPSF